MVALKESARLIGEPFFPIVHSLFDSDAFRGLKPVERDILMLLLRRHNGHNNGTIRLGNREAADWYHCSHSTVVRALQKLERVGLIECTDKGRRGRKGDRPRSSRWKITILRADVER
jgi:DNA-binding MarR family transcriptional regulator